MITLSETARLRLSDVLDAESVLRVEVLNGSSPLAPEYAFVICDRTDLAGDELLVTADGFSLALLEGDLPILRGSVVEFTSAGFELRNPNVQMAIAAAGPIAERVSRVLEERVNPGVAAHGGKISLAAVEDTVVYVKMSGGCQGCGLAQVTLRKGVERMILEAVPEVTEVRDATDHATGTQPFYAANTAAASAS